MKSIQKIFVFGRRQPFGCFVSLLFSIVLVGATLAAFVFVIFDIWSVSLVKSAIYEKTGFNVTAQNIYCNVFTGYCKISKLKITNPEVYDMRELSRADSENSVKFISAPKVEMKLSPSELIYGKFKISSFDADISLLNCVRLTNSTYNLSEFLATIIKNFAAGGEDGDNSLEKFRLKISQASYNDFSTSKDIIVWKMKMNFLCDKTNVSDFSKLLSELRTEFENANAPFISNGLAVLSNEIIK